MALFVDISVNNEPIHKLVAIRSKPVEGSDGWFEYSCSLYDTTKPETEWIYNPEWEGRVDHKYSDGALKLVERVIHAMEEHPDGN